jgi:hypothetical protein
MYFCLFAPDAILWNDFHGSIIEANHGRIVGDADELAVCALAVYEGSASVGVGGAGQFVAP